MENTLEEINNLYADNRIPEAFVLIDNEFADADEDTLLALADYFNELTYYELSQHVLQVKDADFGDAGKIALAESYLGLDNPDLALETLSHINKDSESYLEALLIRADLYQMEEQNNVAEDLLLEAQTISDDPVVRFALAELYFFTEEYSKAILLLNAIITTGTEYIGEINLYQRLANALYYEGEYGEAIETFKKADYDSLNESDLLNYVSALLSQNDDEEAKRILDDLEDTNPVSPDYYLLFARYYQTQGDIESAIRIMQKGISVDDFNNDLKLQLATLLVSNGQTDLAFKSLQNILKLDPDNFNAVNMITDLYIEEHNYEDAENFIKQRVTDENDDLRFNWILGRVQFLNDDLDSALENIDIAYPELDTNPDFLTDAINVYKNFDRSKTMKAISDYLSAAPDSDNEEILELRDSYED